MRLITFSLFILMVTGCASKSYIEQRSEWLKQGRNYSKTCYAYTRAITYTNYADGYRQYVVPCED